ncbi:MAG: hypothetical protein JRE57_19545 [Deltaproteobacteria bacterium]|nr:hypothetical protein [Deltaproteobacteria bacterium]
MSEVGVVSIVVGVVVVCGRGALLVAPAATLHWFEGVIATNGGTRVLGAFVLTLGAAMVWAPGGRRPGRGGRRGQRMGVGLAKKLQPACHFRSFEPTRGDFQIH